MNNLPEELFANITDQGWEWGFVCVEHTRFAPCRVCLFDTPAKIPYSESAEHRMIARNHHRR
jgi:ferredoxin